jgi:hypothetical protein
MDRVGGIINCLPHLGCCCRVRAVFLSECLQHHVRVHRVHAKICEMEALDILCRRDNKISEVAANKKEVAANKKGTYGGQVEKNKESSCAID